jgi:glycerol-3-phosphate dehydrogenase
VDGVWALSLSSGAHERARVVVNAAGPWVSSVLSSLLRQTAPTRVRLVKGSHIVVPRQFEHDRCYLFQNADGRICFAIPYERDFTLIGTTDDEFAGDPASATVSPEDEAYLCEAVSAYLRRPVPVADIVWRYAGVRPLREDGASKAQEATRDYVLELTGTPPVLPPVLSVFGGKITTHRRLAEAALARLAGVFPGMRRAWTAGSPLPGGDFPWNGSVALRDDLLRRFPFVHTTMAERLVRAYGTLAGEMLGNAKAWADLGHYFGATLTQREVDWLVRHEWARTTDDILWRRSKLGLRLTADDIATLQRYLADST